ncbi:30S ribosomal protein S17 [Nitrosomonas sp. JL21]|uniref:30S ribosomal protein S17 n=1 Tax=Nitrosomonas sp. JL21 TaxID=153949 RepID=UPI0013719249|nr:30S ribosomal protein S17 [Nitrosomonas sp.]MXS77675.1 30S ribosomal protein S17 [Nitrosomonas sp. JL21]
MMIAKKNNRTLSGTVTSNKTDKTVTVLVERRIKHPLYGKFITSSKKYHAHDEDNQFVVGDMVMIEESRPISKTKSWKIVKLLKRETELN